MGQRAPAQVADGWVFTVDLLMDWEGVRWVGDPEFRLEYEKSPNPRI